MSERGEDEVMFILGSFRHSQSKEIAALRTQVIGLESDNKRLKSSLATER